MVSLFGMLWVCAIFFGVVGLMRGLRREVVALGGIVLATFGLYQLDVLLRGTFLASAPRDQAFFVQAGLFTVMVYFAYQTRSFGGDDRDGPRNNRFQDAVLGGVVGAINGYLIWGAIWYFLDINDYPLSGLIAAPAPGSISAINLNAIPLVALGGLAGGSGEALTIVVILLFLAVLFIL